MKEKYFSPAKINLFFCTLSKRLDGYHEIASLVQAINLFDILTFSKSPSDRMTCNDPSLKCDDTNLVMRAIKLFRSYYSFPFVHIHLEKRIPVQSGLGGGSSNAATTLFALNQWAQEKATICELQSMGAQIGSDVPFFFSSGTAFCTGRGERVESYPPLSFQGFLAKPNKGLSTKEVYQETRVEECHSIDLKKNIDGFFNGSPHYFNDLEKAAFRLEPSLKEMKEKLEKAGFPVVSMTGSGTAFFCLGEAVPNSDIPLIPFCAVNRIEPSWYCGKS